MRLFACVCGDLDPFGEWEWEWEWEALLGRLATGCFNCVDQTTHARCDEIRSIVVEHQGVVTYIRPIRLVVSMRDRDDHHADVYMGGHVAARIDDGRSNTLIGR